jgi:hypothetical protein
MLIDIGKLLENIKIFAKYRLRYYELKDLKIIRSKGISQIAVVSECKQNKWR